MNIIRKLTKRNIYIALFVTLYLAVGVVSLFHSFAFFGLANNTIMSVLLGVCFEIGQVAVLMSLLTDKKEQSRVMPWFLMCLLTAVQIIGNIFSSYKYLATHSSDDLRFFKEPIFVWTNLPDNVTTVIITYIVGGILPLIALCMTSMVSNYITMTGDDSARNDTGASAEELPDNEVAESEVTGSGQIENTVNENIISDTNDVTPPSDERDESGFVNL